MFFPYGTNAPIYHWPIATVAMIAVSVLVFVAMLSDPDPERIESLVLQYGTGLHPSQWITSNFVHVGFMHLAGNMLSLWSFGLVIEGKLGWYKSLAVYLFIGAAECAIEQVVMLGAYEGFSCGASAIVYGLMAMSLIWAPENDMECFAWIWLRPMNFEMNIKAMVALFLCIEILLASLTGMAMSSSVMHLMGAAAGFAIAIGMVKAKWVDCENWDIFSVWAGRHTMSREELEREEAETPEKQQQREENLRKRRDAALEEIRRRVQSGQPGGALAIHQRMSRELPDWRLPAPDLLGLIKAFHEQKLWTDSIPAMTEYASQHPESAALVRLKLAQILLVDSKRPGEALKVMAKLDEAALDAPRRDLLRRLRAKAKQLRGQDSYEVAEEDS